VRIYLPDMSQINLDLGYLSTHGVDAREEMQAKGYRD
jgi:hypothetical protein